MRNRESLIRGIERMEGQLKNLETAMGRPDTTAEQIRQILSNFKTLLDQQRYYIDNENISVAEIAPHLNK